KSGNGDTTLNKRQWHLLALSARDENALKQLLELYREKTPSPDWNDISWSEICLTAATGRSQLPWRMTLIFNEAKGLLNTKENKDPNKAEKDKINKKEKNRFFKTVKGKISASPGKIAFLFTGQGAQYKNMGESLYRESKVFKQAMDRCDELLTPITGKSLIDILYNRHGRSMVTASATTNNESHLLPNSWKDFHIKTSEPEETETNIFNNTAFTQPLIFSIEYALFKLWTSWGIKPDAVLGHSVGEYAAACAAGVFSLEDGIKLIARRGGLMLEKCLPGSMLSIPLDESQVKEKISTYAQDLVIATINGPESIVVSGQSPSIEKLKKALADEGIEAKSLRVSHAFHSPMMDPMIDHFKEEASSINYNEPTLPIYSNLTGNSIADKIAEPGYWVKHVKYPVKFSSGMEMLLKDGYKVFVEIGPKPILCALGSDIAENIENMNSFPGAANANQYIWLPSLRYGHDAWSRMLESLGQLWVKGFDINWNELYGAEVSDNDKNNNKKYRPSSIKLPNYPFQRREYKINWISRKTPLDVKKDKNDSLKYQNQNKISPDKIVPGTLMGHQKDTILLGQKIQSPALSRNIHIFKPSLDPETMSLLIHHRVFGATVLPAAGHVELALEAGIYFNDHGHNVHEKDKTDQTRKQLILENISINQALVLPDDANTSEEIQVQMIITDDKKNLLGFEIYSGCERAWTLHSSGQILKNSKDKKTIKEEGHEEEGHDSINHDSINEEKYHSINIDSLRKSCKQSISVEDYYIKTHAAGIEHGEKFRALTDLWKGEDQGQDIILARLQLPDAVTMGTDLFQIHPVLLDAAFQTGGVPMLDFDKPYLPVAIDRFIFHKKP
ncbi:MAG: acyltransferase domain-containing protein, partial [Thermodesulfobacteriota bacterium]|nr:acyltransferase domain-containing protein [Thermodesulfobacteriota bacterium]